MAFAVRCKLSSPEKDNVDGSTEWPRKNVKELEFQLCWGSIICSLRLSLISLIAIGPKEIQKKYVGLEDNRSCSDLV